jgi:hypothetical protein
MWLPSPLYVAALTTVCGCRLLQASDAGLPMMYMPDCLEVSRMVLLQHALLGSLLNKASATQSTANVLSMVPQQQ